MTANHIRKTHPMILVAAVALTIFSILGSAAITGLIPTATTENKDMVKSLTDGTGAAFASEPANKADDARVNENAALKAQPPDSLKDPAVSKIKAQSV